jgi:hypothetical protein
MKIISRDSMAVPTHGIRKPAYPSNLKLAGSKAKQ